MDHWSMHLTCSALGDDTCSSYRQCPLDAQSLFQKASCTSADAARSHLRRIASMSLEIWCPDNAQNVFKQQIVSSKNIPHPPCLQALPLQTIFFHVFPQFTSGLQLSLLVSVCFGLLHTMVLHHSNGRVVESLACQVQRVHP